MVYTNLHNNSERSVVDPTLQKRKQRLGEVIEPGKSRARIPPQVRVAPKPLLIKDASLRNAIRNTEITTLQPAVSRFAFSTLLAGVAHLTSTLRTIRSTTTVRQ